MPNQPSFEACLKQIKSFGENPAREVNETTVQAGELAENGNRYSGDLIRLQTDNLPSLVEIKGKNQKILDWPPTPRSVITPHSSMTLRSKC
jgi:hypothetical protein